MENVIERGSVRFTLNDAFKVVLFDGEYYKKQDKNGKDRIRNYRRYLKMGQVTLNQMQKECEKYGFSMLQDSVWKL